MNEQLSKKIEQAVRLIKLAGMDGDPVEVAYSGGKDSDVILQLTREAGINYRAIYKCTTIDPPYTLRHVKENGVEIRMPEKNFFQLIEYAGLPSMFNRFCCSTLKEGASELGKVIIGVRKAESTRRAKRYKEPTECRMYGKIHNELFYPILDWSDKDVVDFIVDRGLKIHPLYYRDDGTIDQKRRVGCMCCPLASKDKRIEQFKQWPNMVRAYVKSAQKYLDTHPKVNTAKYFVNAYEWFYYNVFCLREKDMNIKNFIAKRRNLFSDTPDGDVDYKSFLENYFNVKL